MVSRYLIFCTSCPRCFFFCTASLIRKCFPLTHYFRFKLYIIFNKKRDIEFSNSCPVTTVRKKSPARTVGVTCLLSQQGLILSSCSDCGMRCRHPFRRTVRYSSSQLHPVHLHYMYYIPPDRTPRPAAAHTL